MFERRFRIPHQSAEQLYQILKVCLQRELILKEDVFKNFLGSLDIDMMDESKEFHVKTGLFSGVLRCLDQEIECVLHLSFMALPFRSQLESELTHWILKQFQME